MICDGQKWFKNNNISSFPSGMTCYNIYLLYKDHNNDHYGIGNIMIVYDPNFIQYFIFRRFLCKIFFNKFVLIFVFIFHYSTQLYKDIIIVLSPIKYVLLTLKIFHYNTQYYNETL